MEPTVNASWNSITVKNCCGTYEFYVIISFTDGGVPSSIFIRVAKEGSLVGGLVRTIASLISVALHFNTPWSAIHKTLITTVFDPSGEPNKIISGDVVYSSLASAIAYTIDYAIKTYQERKGEEQKNTSIWATQHAE